MPCYEYFCDHCSSLFEEILTDPADVAAFKDGHPCATCRQTANRVTMSVTNFNFRAPARSYPTQGSGVHGQSGSHSLDYPSLDLAVGRSSEAKWNVANIKKEQRDKIRAANKSNAISTAGGIDAPVDPSTLKARETGLKTISRFENAKKTPQIVKAK